MYTSKTADEFASGEVAVLLQKNNSENVWGQDLKENERDDEYDTSPVLAGKMVYATAPCASGYSNTKMVAFVDPVMYGALMTSDKLERSITVSNFKQPSFSMTRRLIYTEKEFCQAQI